MVKRLLLVLLLLVLPIWLLTHCSGDDNGGSGTPQTADLLPDEAAFNLDDPGV